MTYYGLLPRRRSEEPTPAPRAISKRDSSLTSGYICIVYAITSLQGGTVLYFTFLDSTFLDSTGVVSSTVVAAGGLMNPAGSTKGLFNAPTAGFPRTWI